MGRAPCCDKANVKRGPWSPEEDEKLKEYIEKNGTGGNWIALPQKAGLKRCGKSCRLRWLNYLRPNIKHGEFSDDEDRIICSLFASIGSRWSIIAAQLPGRTDNDIKNYWNTKLKKKLMGMASPSSQRRPNYQNTPYPSLSSLQTLSSSSPYKCINNSYYTNSFTGYELPISILSNFSNTSLNASDTTTLVHQEGYLGPNHHYQFKDSVLMFGGEASCSTSSDGSCNNQISHGRETEHSCGEAMVNFQSYIYNGVEESQKLMASSVAGNVNGLFGDTAIDYASLDEIKQLISPSNNHAGNNNNLNFFFDENKTEEKVVYY